jgi:hypothetical protein
MSQNTRIVIAIVIIFVIVGVVLGVEALRRQNQGDDTLPPGSVPVYLNGEMVGSFAPEDLDHLEQASFVDAEEGKTQEGWRLHDVLLQDIPTARQTPDAQITVSSSSRGKEAQLTWAEVEEPTNNVILDLGSRGTVKLVSTLEKLDVRDEWVQDVDKIEVETQE